MEMSGNIASLALALSKAQSEIKGALKDSNNPFFKSKYADLSSVWDACRGPLTKNELAIVQTIAGDSDNVIVTTMLVHSSGEWVKDSLTMVPVKKDPQGAGSAITYARRYALAAIAGVTPEDDDGNAASNTTTTSNLAGKSTSITPDPVDEEKILRSVAWFKELIDIDQIEENWRKVQLGYAKLSSNERMAVDAQLRDKSPGSNKMYRSLLKEYLEYKPMA